MPLNLKSLLSTLLIASLLSFLFACEPQSSDKSLPAGASSNSKAGAEQYIKRPDTEALRELADDIWASNLQNSTYLRLEEGLPIEQFENLTLEQYRQDMARIADFRERLNSIDGTQLSGDDRVTFEILQVELEDIGANDADYWLTFDITPYVAPYVFRFALQALAAQEIADKASADRYLKLVGELADMIDHLNAKVAGQVDRGIFLPKPALPPVRATWEGFKNELPKDIQPSDSRLAALPPDQQAAFRETLDGLIEHRVVGNLDRLLAAIGEDYAKQATEVVGLAQYTDGIAVYRRRIRMQTTLDLGPEEIHQRGLDAVANIEAHMAAIREESEFAGTAREFVEQIKVDTRFIAQSPKQLERRYMDYIHRVEPLLDAYFKHRPSAAYGVRRLPISAEPGMTYGYYNSPTVDDPVGYYNYNASNLPSRSLVWAGSLIYHELLPGHHFHIAAQDENETLQDFRRKYSVAAFTEGWAEYAASLGIEMGLYETPLELYGRYLAEMFLATRLVVDTGMNALGWSLEDARTYMRDRLIQSDAEIESETLRYSTSTPARALAYRLGYEKIWELRRRAEQTLGEDFDIREFHDVVLSDGAKPLPVLEAKVQRWVKAKNQQE